MAKEAGKRHSRQKPKTPSRRTPHSRIGWELGILFVLLLIVFAPDITRMILKAVPFLPAAAPLIPGPVPAFVYPLWVNSSNYSLTLIAGQGYGNLSSGNYTIDIWTVFGTAGTLNSSNYTMQLGITPIMAPAEFGPGLVWHSNWTSPVSPTTYNPVPPDYTFSISWSGAPDSVNFSMWRGTDPPAKCCLSGCSCDVSRIESEYRVTLPYLGAGNYTYRWTAERSDASNQTLTWNYMILRAPSPLNLTINGTSANRNVSYGQLVQIDAISTAIPDLWVKLNISSAGFSRILNQSYDHASYLLNTSKPTDIPGPGTYTIATSVNSDESSENWTANATTLQLTVAYVNFSNPLVSPPNGSSCMPRTYYFNITCAGSVDTSKIYLILNGSEIPASRVGSTCTITQNNLKPGIYPYHWRVADTAGGWYESNESSYEVKIGNISLELYIDGQPQSKATNLNDDAILTATMSVEKLITLSVSTLNPPTTQSSTYSGNTTVNVSSIYGSALVVPGLWNITAAFTGDECFAPAIITRWIAVNMSDEAAPSYSNVNQTGSTAYRGLVTVSADWSDDTLLDTLWLETNATGVWEGTGYTYSGSHNRSIAFVINVSRPPGSTVGWQLWANDTTGKSNSTDIMEFTVVNDTITPLIFNQSQRESIGNTTDSMIGVGDSITLSANCSDETLLNEAVLATNESGEWEDISSVSGIDAMSAQPAFLWSNESIGDGEAIGWQTYIGWKISCIDYGNNANETDTMSFIVKAFDPADTSKDGRITTSELTRSIAEWNKGNYVMTDLVRIIGEWRNGTY